MKRAFLKDTFRNIKSSLGRFISIAIIVALGVSFFSGLKIAPYDMKYTADSYYRDYGLMDIRLVSTLGLVDEDLQAVSKVSGVDRVEGHHIIDLIGLEGDRELVLKAHSYNKESEINQFELIEGRLPEKANEILVETSKNFSMGLEIGSKLRLESGRDEDLADRLKNLEYTVVGLVRTPYYLSFEKGTSSIGSGQVNGFIAIPEENFKDEFYTDLVISVAGAREVNSYEEDYFDRVDPVKSSLEDLAKEREFLRYQDLVDQGEEELNKAREKYEREKSKLAKELNKAKEDLDKGQNDLVEGEAKLKSSRTKFLNEMKKAKEEIQENRSRLNQAMEDIEKAKADFLLKKEEAGPGLIEAQENLAFLEVTRDEVMKEREGIELALSEDIGDEAREELMAGLKLVDIRLGEINQSISQINSQVTSIKAELQEGEKALAEKEEEVLRALDLIDSKEEELLSLERSTKKTFEEEEIKLNQAKEDIDAGYLDYEKGLEEFEEEFSKALKEIKDGEKEIRDIEKGKWYVLNRKSHYSYMDYKGAADRIDALAKVFPLFFALVAALVCLTTMTRMVDEQRVNIGTLKALGYNNRSIGFKYVSYALLASGLGVVLGILIGYSLFPWVIFNAYGIMYELPDLIFNFKLDLALVIGLVSLSIISLVTYLAVRKELLEVPSNLMRPKAPKIGKRILLERIGFIWTRLNFSYKVTLRNIFRYKRRFFMTVLGIAGSAALMVTAFGIKDSIRDIVKIQYGELFNYQMALLADEKALDIVEGEDRILAYTQLAKEGAKVYKNDIDKSPYIITVKDLDEISKFIKFRERGGPDLKLGASGVIISEQIAKDFKLGPGDYLDIENSDKDRAKAEIIGVTENYAFNYVYMSKEYYEELFYKEADFNQIITINKDETRDFEEGLSKDLNSHEEIKSIEFKSILKNSFEDTIRSLNLVILVMIVSAGSLAFVVLYNLTNVNISERIREIATIKVLGFYNNEVSAYIYRENIILTIIGVGLGLVMGNYLHKFIMLTVEMDNIIFGLDIYPSSYLIASLMTGVFSIMVNIAMYYKLKNIPMVESLKSVD